MILRKDKMLEELINSQQCGHMVGIHFHSGPKNLFVVSKVTDVLSDATDPDNRMILLQHPDINGNPILPNPISLNHINIVIPYRMLYGCVTA